MSASHLVFNTSIGTKKPENIVKSRSVCPFCDRESLEGILEQRGSIIWLKNKFPVLQDTLQTVIIESDLCESDLSGYPKDQLYKVVQFVIEKWKEMQSSGEFSSVMLYKNHGPFSGGSLNHAHMQIVGFYGFDYLKHVKEVEFEGIVIHKSRGIECNLSSKPRAGFYEFNVILSDMTRINHMADYIQILTQFILQSLNKTCKSYNLFFYQWDDRIFLKIVPRFVTSPLFVGYTIPQVSSNLEEIVADIQKTYFQEVFM